MMGIDRDKKDELVLLCNDGDYFCSKRAIRLKPNRIGQNESAQQAPAKLSL